jgi:FKBP-type peptidyl-prolyl cis-trans isomerase FklB
VIKTGIGRATVLACGLAAIVLGVRARAQAQGSPASPAEAARIIGLNVGTQLHQSGVTNEVPIEKIVEGIKDGLAGTKAEPKDQQRLQGYLRSVMETVAARNQGTARAFLERKAREPGVRTTASGLEYKIIEAGKAGAASPQSTDQVTVRYRGTLLDGSEFDGSSTRGAPTTLMMGSATKGWQEALAMMKPGAKWQLFVPPELAYGAAPRPGIPGNSVLIFDLELLSVRALPAPPQAGT